MSQVYATEPSTSGRVIMETTHGPLEIQLWCRECPLTTRLFLQLCIDGYYDDMIFHRIVPDFAIQTGAMRNSSQKVWDEPYRQAVQAQEALERRPYELHSRLRFNHRGQVAMAMNVSDDDDDSIIQPQFFITLDEAPYLDGKHVVFGTIVGPTMFNALRIGRTDVNETTNQPSDMDHAPRILGVEIVDNPVFADLTPQANVSWKQHAEQPLLKKKRKKKRKGKKDVNVLSFGNELEDDTIETTGIQSSHDVGTSQSLSNQVDDKVEEAAKDQVIVKRKTMQVSEEEPKQVPIAIATSDELKQKDEPIQQAQSSTAKDNRAKEATTTSKTTSKPPTTSKRPKQASAVEARLAKYKKKKSSTNNKHQREEDTMAKLFAFQGKVRKQVSSRYESSKHEDNDLAAKMARKLEAQQQEDTKANSIPTYHGQVLDNSDDDDAGNKQDSWLTTKFKCRKNMDLDSAQGADGRTMDEYLVVDEKNGDGKRRHKKHRRHEDRKRHRR